MINFGPSPATWGCDPTGVCVCVCSLLESTEICTENGHILTIHGSAGLQKKVLPYKFPHNLYSPIETAHLHGHALNSHDNVILEKKIFKVISYTSPCKTLFLQPFFFYPQVLVPIQLGKIVSKSNKLRIFYQRIGK